MNNIEIISEDIIAELLTLDCRVTAGGVKLYYNKDSELHRIHGPAVIWPDGSESWCKNGKYHREDGPAVICADGREDYYINGKFLNDNQFFHWQKYGEIT